MKKLLVGTVLALGILLLGACSSTETVENATLVTEIEVQTPIINERTPTELVADFILENYPAAVLNYGYKIILSNHRDEVFANNGGLPRGADINDGSIVFSFELYNLDDSGYYTISIRKGLLESVANDVTIIYRFNGAEYVEVDRMMTVSFWRNNHDGSLMMIEGHEHVGARIYSHIAFEEGNPNFIKDTFLEDSSFDGVIFSEMTRDFEFVGNGGHDGLSLERVFALIREEAWEYNSQFLSWREHIIFFIMQNSWWSEYPMLFNENSAFAILHDAEIPTLVVMDAEREYTLFKYNKTLGIVEQFYDDGSIVLDSIEFTSDIWGVMAKVYSRG